MKWPAHAFDEASRSWSWWACVEAAGRAAANGKKYQRERWHLRALHDVAVLDALASGMASDLASQHGQSDVRVGSVWVDHTPQAKSKYRARPGSRLAAVTCELADLIIVTQAVHDGAGPSRTHTRAVLVQAKVTDVPGVLDLDGGVRSSSTRERNLLEGCSAPLTLWRGTTVPVSKVSGSAAARARIGTYDLGAGRPLGLSSFARYLTIPRSWRSPSEAAYQSMWPTDRQKLSGVQHPIGEIIRGMLDPSGAGDEAGWPIHAGAQPKDWPRMVRDLTNSLADEVVNRFVSGNRSAFPRLAESAFHSAFREGHGLEERLTQLYNAAPPNGNNSDLMDLRLRGADDGGDRGDHARPQLTADDRPSSIPLLVAVARFGPPRDRDRGNRGPGSPFSRFTQRG